jgi:hypothetical protein
MNRLGVESQRAARRDRRGIPLAVWLASGATWAALAGCFTSTSDVDAALDAEAGTDSGAGDVTTGEGGGEGAASTTLSQCIAGVVSGPPPSGCAPLVACLENAADASTPGCEANLETCFGADYATGTIGGMCQTFTSCAVQMSCTPAAGAACIAQTSTACGNCILGSAGSLFTCARANCLSALEACVTGLFSDLFNTGVDAAAPDSPAGDGPAADSPTQDAQTGDVAEASAPDTGSDGSVPNCVSVITVDKVVSAAQLAPIMSTTVSYTMVGGGGGGAGMDNPGSTSMGSSATQVSGTFVIGATDILIYVGGGGGGGGTWGGGGGAGYYGGGGGGQVSYGATSGGGGGSSAITGAGSGPIVANGGAGGAAGACTGGGAGASAGSGAASTGCGANGSAGAMFDGGNGSAGMSEGGGGTGLMGGAASTGWGAGGGGYGGGGGGGVGASGGSSGPGGNEGADGTAGTSGSTAGSGGKGAGGWVSSTTLPTAAGAGGANATVAGGGSGGNAGLVILSYTAATCPL